MSATLAPCPKDTPLPPKWRAKVPPPPKQTTKSMDPPQKPGAKEIPPKTKGKEAPTKCKPKRPLQKDMLQSVLSETTREIVSLLVKDIEELEEKLKQTIGLEDAKKKLEEVKNIDGEY
ncbi:hypothetical protein NDU88_002581 [Pleurodeles waltl]|uniref:Uncharacterized protein n=1 Tax=Pleurodeles waltl TaxID=8319 RepID=A0AAV7WPX4_PLEWA|nr:hypothetical protein NDU88_002581 [Pleurodeles waltl]